MSLLTILYPEGFDCVTGRSDMICDMYAICGKLFVMCAMYVMGRKAIILWAGRQYVMGRKAICCVMDRKVGVGRTGRFTQQGRKSPETHGPEGQGLERRICGWYSGGISLSFRAYSCGFMFQVLKSLWQGKGVIAPFLALMFMM